MPPKLLLAIEKDKSLKERLKKYNLSTKGTRQVLLAYELRTCPTVGDTHHSSVERGVREGFSCMER